MKKIIITGASGTVGQILTMHLAPWYNVIPLYGRNELDLMNRKEVDDFFIGKQYDTVIHCAVAGADNVKNLAPSITHTNLTMYENLKAQYPSFYKFINIASGCELNYRPKASEHTLRDELPVFPYGLSKNLIARDVKKHHHWYNLRLFGLIANTRVFDALWKAYESGKDVFDVYDDKYMDYFKEDDLVTVIRHYIDQDIDLVSDVNLVYEQKYKVSEVLQRYIEDMGIDIKLNVLNEVSDEYTGSGYNLARMNIL